MPPAAELAGLVRSAKHLNQWELLTEFAKSTPATQPTLLMECLWKIGDWEREVTEMEPDRLREDVWRSIQNLSEV